MGLEICCIRFRAVRSIFCDPLIAANVVKLASSARVPGDRNHLIEIRRKHFMSDSWPCDGMADIADLKFRI
jgi:hypothetical protein